MLKFSDTGRFGSAGESSCPGASGLLPGVPASVADALAFDERVGEIVRAPRYWMVQGLDPLGVDGFMTQLPAYLAARDLPAILSRLASVVSGAGAGVAGWGVASCYAALRDLDFLVSAGHAIEAQSYRRVAGLEVLLEELGRQAQHAPRGCNFTYGLFNPADERIRTFSGLAEERVFVRAIQSGTYDLDRALLYVRDLATSRVGSEGFVAAALGLAGRFDRMVEAVRLVRARVPAELFSGRIVCYMQPLEINGRTYPSVTGAQVQNVGIDYVLYGVEVPAPEYVSYVSANVAAMLPCHKAVMSDSLNALGGSSMLARIDRDLARGDVDVVGLGRALERLDHFVSAVLSFRAVHRRLAVANLPLRSTGQGSGGYDLALLDALIDLTRQARQWIRRIRSRLEGTGPKLTAKSKAE